MLCVLLLLPITLPWGTQGADLNVGTTLFTKADSYKECWSSESLALLTSRMILEDLLPSTTILVIDSNEFVTALIEYFRLILEIVRMETHGKTKHITLVALTDLLGGYLHHAVLPIAKYAYYAGLIDYDSMATLMGLFEELKWFLRTNGQGWAKPLPQNIENFEIQRIPLQPCTDKAVCENLQLAEGDTSCGTIIPLPFFDSLTQPSAIALPTKTCPLHNIEANSSSYLVMKFFITAYKCLQAKNAKFDIMQKFTNDFCGWIDTQIMPRLDDFKFYAAFGGVLRVRNTLKRLGVTQNDLSKQIDDFKQATPPPEQATRPPSKFSMILTAVLITIGIWFLLGTTFICYRMRANRQNKDGDDCCGTSTTLTSSKYFYPERAQSEEEKSGRSKSQLHKFNWGRDKHCHEITINTCRCHENEPVVEGEGSSTNMGGGTDGRLPSITEISESTSAETKTTKNPPLSSTTGSSGGDRQHRVNKQIYEESESETEETSEGI